MLNGKVTIFHSFFTLFIVRQRRNGYRWIIPEMKATLFTDPETNNCFSIIAQVLLNSVVNLFCG